MNVTAQLCGDPPAGRSALDGYRHIGTIDGAHRLSEAERKERKYKAKRVRGRTKLCEGIEE